MSAADKMAEALRLLLAKIRRDAPELSGKLMGHCDSVLAEFEAEKAQPARAPAVGARVPPILTQLLDDHAISGSYREQFERAVAAGCAPDGWRIEFGVGEVALHQRGTAQPTYYPDGTVEYALLRDIAAGAQVEAPDLLGMVLDDIAVCIDVHGEHSTEVWESKELSTETVETLEALRRKLKAAQAQPAPEPWEHLKQYGYAPGNYMSRCHQCGATPVMDKRAVTCRPCAEKLAAGRADAQPADTPAAPTREALADVIAAGLSGTWHCTRVWQAWGVGTMSQDDFEPVDESDTPGEIADAILAMLAARAAKGGT